MPPPPKQPGYHYVIDAEGQLVFEQDVPAEGYTTVTWIPSVESATVKGEIVVPSIIFERNCDSYIGERDHLRAKEKTAAAS